MAAVSCAKHYNKIGLLFTLLGVYQLWTAWKKNVFFSDIPEKPLFNDQFRSEYLWPAILLSASTCATFALAVSFFLGVNRIGCRGFFGSVGNCAKSVRCPATGYVILVDNRTQTGTAALVALGFQSTILYMWYRSTALDKTNAEKRLELFPSSFVTIALTSLLCNAVFFAEYLKSNRFLYCGLFPWISLTLLLIQALVCVAESYFSFFTQQHITEPIIGADASFRSNYLVAATVTSIAVVIICGMIQKRPYFVRPSSADDARAKSASEYPDLHQNVSNSTPLAELRTTDQSDLVDSSEFSISWIGRLMFSWTSSILAIGRKKQLDHGDLYKLDDVDMPEFINKRFERHCKPGRSLLASLLLTFAPELIIQALLAFVSRMIEFSGPFFLQRILRGIQQRNNSSDKPNYSSMRSLYLDVICLWFFAIVGPAISLQILWIGRQLGIRIRALLVSLVTAKTLKQRGKGYSEAEDTDSSENKDQAATLATNGKIMNLLSSDTEKVMEVSTYLDPIYTLPIQLITGVWYLYQILGVSALVGISVTLMYTFLSKGIVSTFNTTEKKIREASDKRVTAITELVQGIKAVKLFGWESKFLSHINMQRVEQLKHVWSMYRFRTYLIAGFLMVPALQLTLTFGFYVIVFKKHLTAEVAFTSISLFHMIRSGISLVPWVINRAIGGHVSLVRIEEYLNGVQVQDIQERVKKDKTDTNGNAVLGFEDAYLVWDTKKTAGTTCGSEFSGEQTPLLSSQQLDTSYSSDSDSNGSSSAFSLQSINVQFPIGGLSIVAGPTGSGKTSLLSALIGEMTLLNGYIMLPTVKSTLQSSDAFGSQASDTLKICDIAYVAQEAWLRNATIRENILFGQQYDQKRYEETLHMCSLKQDLRILTAGDMTEIGERGVTLSGGQKQRVALARAVYSNRKILLIDDCLSAVDTHTARHILSECLVGNSSLMQGRTIVLVTHHVSLCLSHARHLVLLQEGKVVLQGTPQQIQDSGAFLAISKELESAIESSNDNDSKDGTDSELKSGKFVTDNRTEDSYNDEHLRKMIEQQRLDPDTDLLTLQGILVKDEEREEGYVKLETWLLYFKESGGGYFWIAAVVLLSIYQLLIVMQDYWIRLWVSTVDSSSQQHSAFFWLGIYVAICVFGLIWWIGEMLFVASGGLRASKTMHAKLVEAIVHAKPRFFDSTPIGRIINRFSRDMQTIDSLSVDGILWWFADIVAAAGVFVVVCSVMPSFALMTILAVFAYVNVANYYLRSSRELNRLQSNSMSPLLSLFGEIIQGVSSIRAFGVDDMYLKEALSRVSMYNRVFYLFWGAIRWVGLQVSFVSASVVLFSALFILDRIDWLDAGMAGFVLSQTLTFSSRVEWAIRGYGTNELNMNAVERIVQYLGAEQEAALLSTPDNRPPSSWPLKGDVQIKNLVVEYVPGVPVLHDVSVSVKHGEKIGIVGRT
ncbi:hypothetical protein H4R99_005770, partial [Coemansia sp. RSA 1722]